VKDTTTAQQEVLGGLNPDMPDMMLQGKKIQKLVRYSI